MKDGVARLPRLVVALLAFVGCDAAGPVLRPVIDAPPPGAEAYPYDAVDSYLLAIARAGDEQNLGQRLVLPGEPLGIDDVAFDDELVVHLSALNGDVEVAYGRTCPLAGSTTAPPAPLAPRLFLSRSVKWSDRWGPDPQPRVGSRRGGHAFEFAGRAVFVGGGSAVVEVEEFDPLAAGTFAPLAETLPRTGAALAQLAGQRALIVGGIDADGTPMTAVELIDPGAATANRVVVADGGPALVDHRAATLVDGSVLVAGGREGAPPVVTASAYLYRLGAGNVLDVPAPRISDLITARAEHSLTRLGDELGADVLVAGGIDDRGAPVPSVELYRPLRGAFEPVAGARLERWGHTAVRLPGGFVVVLGGWRADGAGGVARAREVEVYDPVQGQFATSPDRLPAAAGLTGFSATALPDGRVLLAGGDDLDGAPTSAAFIARLDPVNGRVDVVRTDDLSVPRSGHSAVRLCDGTVLLVGGGPLTAERYNPPSAGRR
jgi:hypothetical protein